MSTSFNMSPTFTANNGADTAPVDPYVVGNGLMCFTSGSSFSDIANIILRNLRVVVSFPPWRNDKAAYFGAKAISAVIVLIYEGLSAIFAVLGHFRRLVPVCSQRVHTDVIRVSHKLQIFEPVVGLVLVLVVDIFVAFQGSPDVLAHNKPVFQNVTGFSGVRVTRAPDQNIPSGSASSPVVPSGVPIPPVGVARKKPDFLTLGNSVSCCLAGNERSTATAAAFNGLTGPKCHALHLLSLNGPSLGVFL